MINEIEIELREFLEYTQDIKQELSKVIVGMEDTINHIISTILAGGHVLLEGIPGLGKTLLMKSIAEVLGLTFRRIQFTPDLMPSDITGTEVLSSMVTSTEREENTNNNSSGFTFLKGPIFSNIILGDEINRATAKTQSALLEAMEEKQVTVLNKTYKLENPFFVLATQNPVDHEGTYPLPEAQMDRFMVKLNLNLPTKAELKEILRRTTGDKKFEIRPRNNHSDSIAKIKRMRKLVRKVFVAEPLEDLVVGIVSGLNPDNPEASSIVKEFVEYGSGPRGAQSLMLLAKVNALIDRRINVSKQDISTALIPTLTHRIRLNFNGEAEGIKKEEVLVETLKNASLYY